MTAFLYAGLPARPHWNHALIGPRFLAAAFCAGPALIILVLQALKRFAGILIEEGLGTIVPGFIPEPWGRVDEYVPTRVELLVSLGLWALGAMVFTILCKIGLPIEKGERRAPGL